MSKAEQVAGMFGYDGQCWVTDDGQSWNEVCESLGGFKDTPFTREHGYDEAYTWGDGSALCVSGSGWDTHTGWSAAR